MGIVCKTGRAVRSRPDTAAREDAVRPLRCRECGNPVTDDSKQIQVNGGFRHVFANPHGMVFEIGCFSTADGCQAASPPSDEFSWFAGFTWQIAGCSQCTNHLGWLFLSPADRFYGLILDQLVFD